MLFDSHTHVNFKDFDADRDAVIQRCLDADIWMINVGTDVAYSKKAIEIAHAYQEGVYASIGIHPVRDEISNGVHPNDLDDADFSAIENMAGDEKVVAIGETGLDYFRIVGDEVRAKEKQKELFMKHVELAKKLQKPLIIHCRDAHDDLIEILVSCFKFHVSGPRGVMHFFTGTREDAQKYLDLGFHLSFSGVLTFTHDYDELVRWAPLGKIVVETDAPFVAPMPYRGKRNEPSYVKYAAQRIADIKGLSLEEVAMQTTQSARELFMV
ncbi:TatD family hydrolase [Candidatus Azambacteria bacterium]|nr:TatD family hydrolase [Candidatus Azambacteria bacterium]